MKKFLILISMLSISFFNFGNECVTSKWGPNDQIGSANLISNQNTLEALKLVKQGKSHGLGVVIEPGMPAFPPRYTQLQVVQPDQHFGRVAIGDYGWDMSTNDDVLQMWLGTGSQIDSLRHLGESQEFYNCTPGKEFAFINGMTKFGIEGLTKGMSIDLASNNIRVNSICPTFVETPMVKKFFLDKSFKKKTLNNIPLGRFATESDIATAVVYLASHASSMMTGSSLVIDGGWTAK